MAVLGSIVQTLMLPMLDTRHDLSLGRAVAGEFIGDHYPWNDALLLEQLAQQALGGFRVMAALDQNIEHVAVLIDRPP